MPLSFVNFSIGFLGTVSGLSPHTVGGLGLFTLRFREL